MNSQQRFDTHEFLFDDARDSLNRFGWFSINKSLATIIGAVPRSGRAIKYKNTTYKVTEQHKSQVVNSLISEFGSASLDIDLDNGIIRKSDQTFFAGKLHVPKSFDELLSIFDGQSSFYRGQANSMWHLSPAIYRDDNPRHEHKFYYKAITQKPNEFLTDSSAFDILVRMQHYEIPTRLIDVSASPLIALYFALQEPNYTGMIFKFQPEKDIVKRFDSLSVSLISNLVKFEHQVQKTKFEWEISREFPKIEFDYDSIMKTISRAYFVKPRWNNPRIALQKGAFIICGTDTDFYPNEHFNKAHKCTAVNDIEKNADKIFITADLKRKAKKILEKLSFGFSDVFPDLQGIAKQTGQDVGFDN